MISIFIFASLVTFSTNGIYPVEDQYLLLTNGQLVAGVVEEDGNNYWVIKKSGSRIAFASEKVVTVAQDLTKIYWVKYGQLSATNGPGHIALFRWCIQNDLVSEAKNQLDVLQLLNIDYRQMVPLQNTLAAKLEQQRKRLLSEAMQLTSLPNTGQVQDRQTTTRDHQVKPAGFEAALDQRHRSAVQRAEHAKELKLMTKRMPDHSVVMFKRKIEPIMIRSCYTAKCHDADASKLPLRIAGKGIPIPKRMSQENLFQVLKYTNIQRPLDSQLLSAAALPHVGMDKPLIKIESEQFQILRAWLISISSNPYQSHLLPRSYLESDLIVQQQSSNLPASIEQPEPSIPPGEGKFSPIPKNTPQSPPANKEESDDQSDDDADPFDPEKFNRRFLTDKKEPEEVK